MNDSENAEKTAGMRTQKEQNGEQPMQQRSTFESLSVAIKSATPPRRELTKKETLVQLKKDLVAAIKVGHTPASLTDVLRNAGLNVSQRAVANLVRETKQKSATSSTINAN